MRTEPWSLVCMDHLADVLQCRLYMSRLYMFYQYVCSLGIEPTTFCVANTMLYHWATGTSTIRRTPNILTTVIVKAE